MKSFRVWRRGPNPRVVLTVFLRVDHGKKRLILAGDDNLLESLRTEGVEDLATGENFKIASIIQDVTDSRIYDALLSHFERASAYFVRD